VKKSNLGRLARLALAAVLAIALAAVASACGEKRSTEGAAATQTAAADERLKITYIPKNLGNPYFDAVVDGLRRAAESENYDLEVVGPAQAGATDQISYIDAAVQQRVDAIAISPNDPDAVAPSLQKAMAAGIKVVSVNSDMNPKGRQVAILPTDFSRLGAFLVELQGSVQGDRGKFAILSATSTAPDQNAWIEGVRAELESNHRYADLELVDVVYGDDEPDKSFTQTKALLTKHKDLQGILSPTTVGVAAAAQYISGTPQKGRLALTGLGTPDQMRKFIDDGTVEKFALWDPAAEGDIAGRLMAGMARGTLTGRPGETFEGPDGQLEITPEGQVITGPPVEFTKANIDDFHF
jgi:rhamnose transport system substrate-binding protein